MTWSRFDDAARKHPKAAMAGNEAWGFWCAAIMYSNQFGTDGFIPDAALATDLLPVPIAKTKAKKLAEKLCAARIHPDKPALFIRDNQRGGYVVNGFLDWNPSKAEVDSKRKKDRERKRGLMDDAEDSARNPIRNPTGFQTDSDPESERPTHGHARPARAEPSPPAQPAVPVPVDPTCSQPAKDLTAKTPPKPPNELAARLVERSGRKSGELPRPRHDPLEERIRIRDWFPSQAHLDWQREIGMSDADFDQVFVDAKNKFNGTGTIEFWDGRIETFFEAAARNPRTRPQQSDPNAARKKAEREAAETERARRKLREQSGSERTPEQAKADVAKATGGLF